MSADPVIIAHLLPVMRRPNAEVNRCQMASACVDVGAYMRGTGEATGEDMGVGGMTLAGALRERRSPALSTSSPAWA